MDTLRHEKVKARKEHKCSWCTFKINKDEIYYNSSHVDEGYCYTWKNHLYCSEILDKVGAFDQGDGVGTEDFREYIMSEYQEIMSDNFTEAYESKEFRYPSFQVIFDFVLAFHKISKL